MLIFRYFKLKAQLKFQPVLAKNKISTITALAMLCAGVKCSSSNFYYGDSALIYIIKDRQITTKMLGGANGSPSIVMPSNTWFAIRSSGLKMPALYTLMSCSITPGFECEDLVIGDYALLDELEEGEHKLALSLLKSSEKAFA